MTRGRPKKNKPKTEHPDIERVYSPPTEFDYKETARLFRDFGITSIAPPKFETRNALYHWRSQKILAALA